MYITDLLKKRTDRINRKAPLSDNQYDQMIPCFEASAKIPKNIFQICLSGGNTSFYDVISDLSPDFMENIEQLKQNNPDYKYHLISDKEARQFIIQYYGNTVWSYYQRIDDDYLAAKADLLRYLLLYALGGVYLDLKSTIARPLSDVIRDTDRFFVFYWDNMPNGQRHYLVPEYATKGEMLQGFIISARGHFFLRKVILNVLKKIDQYNPYIDGVGWEGTLKTTGPIIYLETIHSEIHLCQDQSCYREDKPFKNFGFRLSFAGTYTPGHYQKRLSMKDYRKSSRPVVVCSKRCLQMANICWLKILWFYREKVNECA